MKGPDPRLADATLPIMPHTQQALRHLLGRHSTRHPQLNEVLLSDPGASIAVFRALGRTRPSAAEQVTDPGHALSMIGLEAFRTLLDSLPRVETPSAADQGHDASIAYSQAAHAAIYAGALADRLGIEGRSEIGTAALLQNPAVLALWAVEPESARRATNAVRDGVSPDIAFRAELGETLQDANRRLAGHWTFPRLARQAMDDWDDFNPRPRMVSLADGLAQTTAAGWQHENIETFTTLLADALDIDHDQARGWLHQRTIEAARALSRFNYPLPGFELMFMAGATVDEEPDHEIPAMGRPRAAPPDPAPDLHTAMAGIMRRIRDEAGADRVVFAMLNRSRSRLRTRLALGGTPADALRRLDLDMRSKHLFAALLGRPQSVWLNSENAERYRPYLPDPLRRMMAAEGAYLMSLFVGERALGLLYADGPALDAPGYRRFRNLCEQAGQALAAGRTPVDPADA